MTKPIHHVIYIPGLADHTVRNIGQALLVRLWRYRFKIEANYYTISWADKRAFKDKLSILLKRVDHWVSMGHTVSLVASSAGATMAIHALAAQPKDIHRVVIICGVLGQINLVAPELYVANPAFKTSMQLLPSSIKKLSHTERAKILSVKPQSDGVVKLEHMNITGAHYLHLPTHGHIWSIIAALTKYSHKLVQFITSD